MERNSIWRRPIDLTRLNSDWVGPMMTHLGIRFEEIGTDFLIASMPVDERNRQMFGVLHGGASVVLIETLASTAGTLCVPEPGFCVGLEVNASHLRAVAEGRVLATARPVRIGGSIQVWNVRIVDTDNHDICTGRMTLKTLEREPDSIVE